MALEYLKELRQNGTNRRDEMSILINGGFRDYQAIKEAEEAEVGFFVFGREYLDANYFY